MLSRLWKAVPVILGASLPGSVQAGPPQAGQGEEHFRSVCAACHTVGGGRLVGPDLQGVTERRTEQWIIDFVQHPQQRISAGDSTAVALFKEYDEIPMPDQALSAADIRGILQYVRGAPASAPSVAAAGAATEDDILLGRALFQGPARFANSGPTCTSCHDVLNDAVAPGGALARALTSVYTRIGGAGIEAILHAPPFPVMRRAYQDAPLTEQEIIALTGFLRRVDEQRAGQEPRTVAVRLFAGGMGGVALLLALYSLAWSGRSKGSVNQAIYDRQVGST